MRYERMRDRLRKTVLRGTVRDKRSMTIRTALKSQCIVWGAGNTLGDSATPSKPVSANPTEGVRSLFNQFQGLDPGIKLIAVLAVVYLLYVFVLS